MTRNRREEKMTLLLYNQSFRMMHISALKIVKPLGCKTKVHLRKREQGTSARKSRTVGNRKETKTLGQIYNML